LVAVGAILTVTYGASAQENTTAAAPAKQAFVRIQDVKPNQVNPKRLAGASSTSSFIENCGTNGNKKFSPDNPVAQPGIKNGAEHVHDFVGNLSTSADSTDASLDAAGTTCKNQDDKSAYFWPVVRINAAPVANNAQPLSATQAGTPTIVCPTVGDKLPAVPASAMAEVQRNITQLGAQISEANQRLAATKGQGGANFINNAILGPLKDKRAATIDRIATAIGRTATKPTNLAPLAGCELNYEAAHKWAGHNHPTTAPSPTGAAPAASDTPPSSTPPAGSATPTVNCPTVRDKLPGIPDSALAEVNQNLALLDSQIAEANQRLVTTQGQGGADFINNAILGPLKDKRVATLNRIATAIGRAATKPTNLGALAPCTLNNGGGNDNGGGASASASASDGAGATATATAAPSASATGGAVELPAPSGPNNELPGNAGVIQRPVSAKIEYRGNATTKVVAMPKFLRELTGDAKPTSRGPANARSSWTCSGFENRLTNTYVICPQGSKVERINDFPGCWDGKNTDSANHRTHVAFADPKTGACGAGFVAIPQLRITLQYNIPVNIQKNGQYAVDSFPEENHNPFSDHNDFINVNSVALMAKITNCINTGRGCW
jgi:hypothetical protein